MGTDTLGTGLPWVDAIARSFAPRPFADFHRRELPELVGRNGHLVADDLRGVPPLGVGIEHGTAFTWHASELAVEVAEGDGDAVTLVELSEATFSEFLHELLTASGAVRTGRARMVRGSVEGWQRWEPALRSLDSGRPIYGEGVWGTLVDRAGEPLDLHRTFEPDGEEEEMRHFLRVAGYLHVKHVFSADEVARWSAEVEHARSLTPPGDPYSWWSVTAAGEEVPTRINYLNRMSRVIDELDFDPRLL